MNATEALFGYSIKNGPSRTDLIRAFTHAKDDFSKKPISFEIVENYMVDNNREFCRAIQTRNTRIIGLKYDGDSQCAFVIEGSMDIFHLIGNHNKTYASPLNCKFTACYDSMTRKGKAVFLVPS